MSDIQIVAIDAGHGGTNSATYTGNSKRLRTDYFPSVRAKAYGHSLNLGKGHELQYEFYDYNGERYVAGDDVVRVTDEMKERHHGGNRYGGEFHSFLVAVALNRLKVPSGPVRLVMFAPPSLYNIAREQVNTNFPKVLEIKPSSNKQPKIWEIVSIDMIPEGLGAISAVLFDDKGAHVGSDIFDGNVLTIDIGLYTLDAVLTVDGGFNQESLKRATFEKHGLKHHVFVPILEHVNQVQGFEGATIDHIDMALRHPERKVVIGTFAIPLGELFDQMFDRYANWIANEVIDTEFNGLKTINRVITVGGGANDVDGFLRKWYPNRDIMEKDKHPLTRNIHPTNFSVIGGLRLVNYKEKENSRKVK